jgi:alkanesulfonate monooxygenase SsuD/methylene tetrahydromethanopterin reductase-like flavin-dependent oxidoreductase (luciferase family)
MRIGISVTNRYEVKDVRQGVRWMIERAKAAAEAGLDSLSFGDHHASLTPSYQNTPILARSLAVWRDAPAGALYLLPFRHPVLLAEEIGTLASIAPNRFIMQCGLGHDDRQFAAFGVNPKHRPSRFEECLEIMRRLWAGETISHQGRWQIREARISPTPPEKIEVWIAANAEPAIERAARLGDGWLASPRLIPEHAKRDLDRYLEYCVKHQREPGVRAIRRDVYVGENQQEAEATAGKVGSAGYHGMLPEDIIVGDVEVVAKAFNELAQIGFTDVIIRNLVSDQSTGLASIARLGKVKELVG